MCFRYLTSTIEVMVEMMRMKMVINETMTMLPIDVRMRNEMRMSDGRLHGEFRILGLDPAGGTTNHVRMKIEERMGIEPTGGTTFQEEEMRDFEKMGLDTAGGTAYHK